MRESLGFGSMNRLVLVFMSLEIIIQRSRQSGGTALCMNPRWEE